jgi:hypothetical protein
LLELLRNARKEAAVVRRLRAIAVKVGAENAGPVREFRAAAGAGCSGPTLAGTLTNCGGGRRRDMARGGIMRRLPAAEAIIAATGYEPDLIVIDADLGPRKG